MLLGSTHLDNPIHANTRLGEYALDVLAAHLCLIRNASFDQVALGVGGDLARDEDIGACDDGLCLWSALGWVVAGTV